LSILWLLFTAFAVLWALTMLYAFAIGRRQGQLREQVVSNEAAAASEPACSDAGPPTGTPKASDVPAIL